MNKISIIIPVFNEVIPLAKLLDLENKKYLKKRE
jgi:glycosyltransferase involved in cell wall biosynthesis